MSIQKFAKIFISTGIISCVMCLCLLVASCSEKDEPVRTGKPSLLGYLNKISYQIENRIIWSYDSKFKLTQSEKADLDKMFKGRYITELQVWTFLAETRQEAIEFAAAEFGEGYLLKIEDQWGYVIVSDGF